MRALPVSAIVAALALAGCPKAGGAYVETDSSGRDVDRGETQGRMFDFVSNLPEGDDWQIRIRGSSLWASYADEDEALDLGTVTLARKDTDRVWRLIDKLELEERGKGRKDEDEGYFQLRLREPGGDEGHDIIQVYVPRDSEDEDVTALAEFLAELISRSYPKYRKERPEF